MTATSSAITPSAPGRRRIESVRAGSVVARVGEKRSLRPARVDHPGGVRSSPPRCGTRASRPAPGSLERLSLSTGRPRSSVSSRCQGPAATSARRAPASTSGSAAAAGAAPRAAAAAASPRPRPYASPGRPVLAGLVGDQARLLGLALAASQHPQAEDRRPEHRDQAEAELDAEQALAAPVDVLELEQQRRLVEGHPDPRPERHREHLLEPVALRAQPGAPGEERDQDPGDEVMHVASAEADVPRRPPAAADAPGREAHERERADEAAEQVEQDRLAASRPRCSPRSRP